MIIRVTEADHSTDEELEREESSAGTVVLTRSGDAAVLSVTGALDLAMAPRLRQVVERAVRLRPALMVIDLTGLSFLASAGMAVLLFAQKLGADVTRVRVVANSRVILRPLELTRLTDELAIFPTTAEALDTP
jgi:anti-sigma B factor antagonist